MKTEEYKDLKTLRICPVIHKKIRQLSVDTGENIQELAVKLITLGFEQLLKGGIN